MMKRRNFIKTAAVGAGALAFPTVIPSSALGLDGTVAPSNRIGVAVIGVRNQGRGHARSHARSQSTVVTHICDVKLSEAQGVKQTVDEAQNNTDCKAIQDYRELVANPEVDAVVIATPEHWHAIMTTEFARAGKHVYCEKPLTRTFREAQILRDVVKKSGIVFQHGTQHRSDPAIGRGCDIVLSGRIGKLKHVRLVIPSGGDAPNPGPEEIPTDLNWDLWLGPAPVAPYSQRRWAGGWYSISDYCMGRLAGWGAHHVDTGMQGSGDPAGPLSVDGTAIYPKDGLFDNALHWEIRAEFPGGLTWHVIDTQQDPQFVRKYRSVDGGVLFECEGGSVMTWRSNIVASDPPSILREPLKPEELTIPRPSNHRQDWIDAIKTGKPVTAPVDIAVRSYTVNLLLEITTRLGRKIQWDSEKEDIVGDEEARRMLWREYRAPWRLEA